MKLCRMLALVLAMAMMLTFFAACGGGNDTTAGVDTSDPTGTTGDPTGTTGDPTGTTSDPTDTTGDPSDTDAPGSSEAPGGDKEPDDLLRGLPDKMPVIRLNTHNEPIVSKDYYIDGLLSVENTEEEWALDEEVIEIRGRGNFSWIDIQDKKSYRIKFAEKTNLLGQGAGPARSWTLVAIHCDKSLLRNAAAYKLADSLSGIDYSSSIRFAELYLNGEYQGVYQVSEQMQVQDYRINVDDTVEGYDIGFLVELDKLAEDVIITDGFNTYEVKSDTRTSEQLAFIEGYITDSYYAVLSGNKADVEELIDLDSVVDTYIVEEVFKNLDVGWGSFYMYRDVGGKLFFGPVWDFDLAGGNADANDRNPSFPLPEYIYVGSGSYGYSQQHSWFIELCRTDWFNEMVKKRWGEITEELNAIPAFVRAAAKLYAKEFNRNFEKYPIFDEKINREPAAVLALKSHADQAEYLAKWLEQRIAWLDDYFAGKVEGEPSKPGKFECSGGEGTKASPYLISKPADFYSFTQAMFYGETFAGKYFLQTVDLDMTTVIGYNGIGAPGSFGGIYDGGGHKIHAVIAGNDECIFPYVNGVVMNLITTGSVTNSTQAAGISRSVRREGAIINCMSTMALTSTYQNAGGIVASNQAGGGIVSGCIFAGTISAAESGGAINVFIDGRGGTFNYNYYLAGSEGTSVGEETAFTAEEGKTLHNTLNANLNKVAQLVRGSNLCRWKAGGNGLPVMETK